MSIVTPSYRPDPARTGISLAYRNQKLIADEVLPRVQVGGYTFYWNKFNLADRFTLPDMILGRDGEANTVEFGITRETGFTEDFGLGGRTPEVDVEEGAKIDYDPLDAMAVSLTDLLLLRHEKSVADVVHALGTYPSANRQTLSGTSQFSHADSRPYDVINAALDDMLMRANVLVFNNPGLRALRKHPQITAMVSDVGIGNSSITGSAGRQATNEQLAQLFEVDRVVSGNSRVNTADFDQPVSLARCWGNHLAMLHVDPNVVSAIGQAVTFGFVAEKGTREAYYEFEPKRGRRGAHYQRIAETVRPIIAASDVGYFFQSII